MFYSRTGREELQRASCSRTSPWSHEEWGEGRESSTDLLEAVERQLEKTVSRYLPSVCFLHAQGGGGLSWDCQEVSDVGPALRVWNLAGANMLHREV